MAEHLTEEEQVEALKNWWKENGKSVLGGIVLGLAIVLGWQGWERHTKNRAEQASAYFQQFMATSRSGDAAQALEQGKRLLDEFEGMTYATLAALQMARIEYQQGDEQAAISRLRQTAESAGDPALQRLAQLRLARLLIASGDGPGAAALVAELRGTAFAGEAAVLSGDLARAAGDLPAARQHYQDALTLGVGDTSLVRMKLADTGVDPDAASPAAGG